MSVDNAILFTVLILFSSKILDTFAECISETRCSCVMPNGDGYDLSQIPGPKDEFIPSSTVSNRTFYFHPCSNKAPVYPGKHFDDCSSKDGVSLCLYNSTDDKATSFGVVADSKMTLKPNGAPQMIFNHVLSNGTRTAVSIDLICAQGTDMPTKLMEYDGGSSPPNYTLLLVSPHACKKQMHSVGLSTGSVLVIILFVFSGIYFAGGALTLKLLRGATGWEMLPNHKFWFDFPALVRDGIAFTFNGCKVVSYDQI